MRCLILVAIGLAGVCLAQGEDPSFQRGAALYRSADCHAAIPLLEHSAATNPRASLLLARCYFDLQQWDKATEAVAAYRKSIPGDLDAAILDARIKDRDGHPDAAAAILNDFLKLHPNEPSVRTALADLYIRAGRESDARTVLQGQPADPGSRIGEGLLLLRQQKWQAAIDQLEKVRVDVPEDVRVLSGLGSAYAALGNCERAVDPLRQALDLSPGDYALAKKLAACDSKLKRWSAVLGALHTGTIEESRDEEATRMVLEAYSASADLVDAEAYCRWAIIATPANFTAHLSLANLLYTAKRLREAYNEYAEAVKLKPDSPGIHERMGDISMEQRDFSDARAQYEAAVQSANATDTARLKLARLCFASDDLKCVTQTVAGVTTPALLLQAKSLRARVEYKSGHLDQAGVLANEALSGDPENSTLLRIAAEAAARQNKLPDAVALYQHALKLEPANKDLMNALAALDSKLGAQLYHQNQFGEAYPYMMQAAQLNPTDEAAQLNLALICLELGKMDEVNTARAKLVSMNSSQVPTLDAQIELKKNAKP